ncbi:MAG: hypothetical protein LQ338_001910 [Usnochroma carphineum]|nr:MAG: hypothetical protein LQ338_001910 [Usnochroma carphineum]
MIFRRTALTLSGRAAFTPIPGRALTTSLARRETSAQKGEIKTNPEEKHHRLDPIPGQTADMIPFDEIKSEKDLLPPGAAPGTVPTDLEQATGLERFEILGKMQGIDVFDMKPLDASRLGTLKDPIMVKAFGDEQYCGCTGFPADSHNVLWITLSRAHPLNRCKECGSCYKMEYVGPPDDPHDDHHDDEHPRWVEKKTWADYVRPEYRDGR